MLDDWRYSDEWRRQLAPRHKSYPPPDVPIYDYSVADECVCLRINVRWVPFLTGVLALLEEPIYWQTDDPEFPLTSIIELQTALHGASELMNCNPSEQVTNITFEGGVLTIHYADNSTVNVEGSERIVTGVNVIGSGQIEVEQGGEFDPIAPDCETCGEYPDTPAYDKAGNERSCAIANGLTEFLHEKYNDQIDEFETAADVFLAADAWTAIFPPAYILFDQVTDAMGEIAEATTSAARAFDTVERREEFATELYCRLIENGHEMTEELWQAFKDEYLSGFGANPVEDYYRLYFNSYKAGGIIDRSHRESYRADEICATYGCGELCVDFETAEDYEIVSPNGEWSSGFGEEGAGIRDVGTLASDWLAEIVVDFFPLGNIGGISLRVHSEAANSDNSARNHYLWVRGWNGTSYENLYGTGTLTSPDANNDDVWVTIEKTWSPAEYEHIRVSLAAGGNANSNLDLRMDNVCFEAS